MSDAPVYFASDSHFGAGSPESQRRRVDLFARWLNSLESGANVYLLGDIFDFWLDYPTYMPKVHLDVLYPLRLAQDRGVTFRFVGGNHDVWCADFLRNSLGIESLENGQVVEHHGVRLRLHHGDGLLGGDRLYKLFRAAVRNPVLVFVAKSLHPEILHAFATWLSNQSRESHGDDDARIVASIRRYGRSHDHSDVDHLVVGHVHVPHQERFDGWTFTCLGDWVSNFTYGKLDASGLSLQPVTPPVPVPANS